MITANDVKFGRLVPMDRGYEDTYSFAKVMTMQAKTVERILPLPGLRVFYDQGDMGSCVGNSASWRTSIVNAPPQQKYDAVWLYHMAQKYDKDPLTTPEADNGSYVWAAFWVLMHFGHKKLTESKPDINDGIFSYYWGRNADHARTAIALGRPPVIGIPWFDSFFSPEWLHGEWWIGKRKDLGAIDGGHAVCINGASDKRQATSLVMTWGMKYPTTVWLPYDMLDYLMFLSGEMTIAIDNPKVT
jgi:hypothetical protein